MVVLDQVSTPEAELLLELAYGMGRLAKILNSLITSVPDDVPPPALFTIQVNHHILVGHSEEIIF